MPSLWLAGWPEICRPASFGPSGHLKVCHPTHPKSVSHMYIRLHTWISSIANTVQPLLWSETPCSDYAWSRGKLNLRANSRMYRSCGSPTFAAIRSIFHNTNSQLTAFRSASPVWFNIKQINQTISHSITLYLRFLLFVSEILILWWSKLPFALLFISIPWFAVGRRSYQFMTIHV